jgi:hypothetical protein
MGYLKNWQEIFKDPTVSLGDKIQILFGLLMLGIFAFIGLMYLTGTYEVESEPTKVEITENVPFNPCSDITGECYDIDPPDQWVDDFPSRP